MNTLLGTVATQFAKPLLLAGVLPVIITVSLLLLVTYPRFPFPVSPPAALKTVDPSWQVTWASLLVVVAGMLLYVLNTPILRFLSGYPWRRTPIGRAMTQRKVDQRSQLKAQRDGLLTLYLDLLPSSAAADDIKESENAAADRINRALTPLSNRLNDDYPYDPHLILPTKLGNVIRNSEDYSRQLYGASIPRLWPRLVAVIDSRYAAVIDDAKTNMDFMVNCAVLFFFAAVLTVMAAWQARAAGVALVDAGSRVLFFGVIAALAYAAAIERARSWGGFIKASVDLYRRALAKQLEYTYTFTDVDDERKRFWSQLSALWVFPELRDRIERLPFVQTPQSAALPPVTGASSDNAVPLMVARGITPPAGKPYATTTVTLRVQNAGGEEAKTITVVDPIPAGWTFVWGSEARAGGGIPPTLKSSLPNLELTIDSLAKAQAVDVTYQLQSLTPTL